MKSYLKVLTVTLLVLAASVVFYSSPASAQVLPYLGNSGGNYTYTDNGDGTGSLVFTDLLAGWTTYTDFTAGCNYPAWAGCANPDAIIGQDWVNNVGISFGELTNSTGSPTFFGSSISLSVYELATGDEFFSATIDSFDTSLNWMNLSNVVSGVAHDTYNSRYVNELIAIGNGSGNLQFVTFMPDGGGPDEDFIGSSSGAVSLIVAAPEPISAVLFITGGATLALRRFRRKRN